MKRKSILRRIIMLAMAAGMVLALPAQAATPRKANDCYWPNTPRSVNVKITGFTSAEKTAVLYSMGNWNAIKNASGQSFVYLGQWSSGTCSGEIYKERGGNTYAGRFGVTFLPTYGGGLSYVKILINTDMPITVGAQSGTVDLQSVAEHELGHFLGVAHCHEDKQTCTAVGGSSNVMDPAMPYGYNRRTLQTYDISSYRTIYQ